MKFYTKFTPIFTTLWLFLIIMLMVFSCSTKTTKSVPDEVGQFSDNLPNNNESTATAPDRIIEKKLRKGLFWKNKVPMLLVQNHAGLWPVACDTDDDIKHQILLDSLTQYFGNNNLVSIGINGTQPQNISKVFCVQGECGGNQIAFELKNKESLGVLVNVKLAKDKKFHPVKRKKISELLNTTLLELILKNDLETETILSPSRSLIDSVQQLQMEFFTDSAQKYVVHNAFLKYNVPPTPEVLADNPYANNEQYIINFKRTYFQVNKGWILSSWKESHSSLHDGQQLVMSVAYGKKELYTFSYQTAGICCPSESSIIYSVYDLSKNKIKLKKSSSLKAGLGQPCD